MVNRDMTFGYNPISTPTFLGKQKVGKPSQNAAQPCARVQGYVNDDLMADGLQKGWGFRVSTWNVYDFFFFSFHCYWIFLVNKCINNK